VSVNQSKWKYILSVVQQKNTARDSIIVAASIKCLNPISVFRTLLHVWYWICVLVIASQTVYVNCNGFQSSQGFSSSYVCCCISSTLAAVRLKSVILCNSLLTILVVYRSSFCFNFTVVPGTVAVRCRRLLLRFHAVHTVKIPAPNCFNFSRRRRR